jgi:hypothetical protein
VRVDPSAEGPPGPVMSTQCAGTAATGHHGSGFAGVA